MFFSFLPILKGCYGNPIIVEMNILENKLESMQVESIIIMIMILHFNFLLLSRHWCSLKKKKNGLWIRDKLRGIKLKKKKN